jgi:hypothetical protein
MNNISVLDLYLKRKNRKYVSSSIEDSEASLLSARNDAGLKRQSSFVRAILCRSSSIRVLLTYVRYPRYSPNSWSLFLNLQFSARNSVLGLARIDRMHIRVYGVFIH